MEGILDKNVVLYFENRAPSLWQKVLKSHWSGDWNDIKYVLKTLVNLALCVW